MSSRSRWITGFVALLCLVLAGAALGRPLIRRHYLQKLEEARVQSEVEGAFEGIFAWGDDGTLAGATAIVVRRWAEPWDPIPKPSLGDLLAKDRGRAKAILAALVRHGASARTPDERESALWLVCRIARPHVRGPMTVHRDGHLYCYEAIPELSFDDEPSPSPKLMKSPPPFAVCVWAEWLVAHGLAEPSLPGLLGERPPAPAPRRTLGIQLERGAAIAVVASSGIAARMELAAGDRIVAIATGDDTADVTEARVVHEALAAARNDAQVSVTYERAGQRSTVTLLRAGRPFGATLVDGIRVKHVIPELPAASAGIRRGDLIRAVNDVPVSTLEDAGAALAKGSRVKVTLGVDGATRDVVIEVPASSER